MTHYLIALREPLHGDALPRPEVVASIDARFIGHHDVVKLLTVLANKMGLTEFDIQTGEAQDLPGRQLDLPLHR